jgi:hypothetical protein
VQKKDRLLPELLNPPTGRGQPIPADEVARRLRAGWRCVRFEHCYSFLLATVRRQSGVYLTKNWKVRCLWGFGYAAAAVALGPWGIPWGPVWTFRAAWINLTGGDDVTAEVLAAIETAPPSCPTTRSSIPAAPADREPLFSPG